MSRGTLLALLVPFALAIAGVIFWLGAPVAPERASEEGGLPRISLGELGTGGRDAILPTRIDYPLQDKYREQVWSDVPHELIAAYDGLEANDAEGPRRGVEVDP